MPRFTCDSVPIQSLRLKNRLSHDWTSSLMHFIFRPVRCIFISSSSVAVPSFVSAFFSLPSSIVGFQEGIDVLADHCGAGAKVPYLSPRKRIAFRGSLLVYLPGFIFHGASVETHVSIFFCFFSLSPLQPTSHYMWCSGCGVDSFCDGRLHEIWRRTRGSLRPHQTLENGRECSILGMKMAVCYVYFILLLLSAAVLRQLLLLLFFSS